MVLSTIFLYLELFTITSQNCILRLERTDLLLCLFIETNRLYSNNLLKTFTERYNIERGYLGTLIIIKRYSILNNIHPQNTIAYQINHKTAY